MKSNPSPNVPSRWLYGYRDALEETRKEIERMIEKWKE